MTVFQWIVVVVVAIPVALSLVGALLPRNHLARRRATFAKRPDELFATLTDVAAYPSWRGDVKRVEMVDAKRFVEHGKQGRIAYEVTESTAPRRLVLRIADEKLAYGGTWTFELEPREGGTTLTITEDGFIKNLALRVLARFVFGYASTIEAYLRALGRRCGEDVAPEPA